jgi:hypothetical protein
MYRYLQWLQHNSSSSGDKFIHIYWRSKGKRCRLIDINLCLLNSYFGTNPDKSKLEREFLTWAQKIDVRRLSSQLGSDAFCHLHLSLPPASLLLFWQRTAWIEWSHRDNQKWGLFFKLWTLQRMFSQIKDIVVWFFLWDWLGISP